MANKGNKNPSILVSPDIHGVLPVNLTSSFWYSLTYIYVQVDGEDGTV